MGMGKPISQAKKLTNGCPSKASSASPSDSGVNSDNDSSSSRPGSGAGIAARFQLNQESLEIESVSRTLQNLTALRDELGQAAAMGSATCSSSPTFLPPPPPQFCDGNRDTRLSNMLICTKSTS